MASCWDVLARLDAGGASEQHKHGQRKGQRTMTTDVSNFLQYGAFGLLSLVLIAVGVWFRDYSKKQQQMACEQQDFVRELAKQALASQDEHMEQWREMTCATLKAQAGFTQSLQEINGALGRLSQEHSRIEARLG